MNCDHCGKTDFDLSEGCKRPHHTSFAVGDWCCTYDENIPVAYYLKDDEREFLSRILECIEIEKGESEIYDRVVLALVEKTQI